MNPDMVFALSLLVFINTSHNMSVAVVNMLIVLFSMIIIGDMN